MRMIVVAVLSVACASCRSGGVTLEEVGRVERYADTLSGQMSENLTLTLYGVEFRPESAGPVKSAARVEIKRGLTAQVELKSVGSDSTETHRQPSPAGKDGGGKWRFWLGVFSGLLVLYAIFCVLSGSRRR